MKFPENEIKSRKNFFGRRKNANDVCALDSIKCFIYFAYVSENVISNANEMPFFIYKFIGIISRY